MMLSMRDSIISSVARLIKPTFTVTRLLVTAISTELRRTNEARMR